MQDRNRATGKVALVLLSLVVLELALAGHHLQPVMALKKKIYLKKLRKILPLLALVKPKKKVILVPIPIPMFDKLPPQAYAHYPHHPAAGGGHSLPMSGEGSSPPMSFMMMEPNLMGDSSLGPQLSLAPPSMSGGGGGSSGFEQAAGVPSAAMSMLMPSMTMTIQSDGSGTMSAIELGPASAASRPAMMSVGPSASSASSPSQSNNTVSGALIAGQPSKWLEQQQFQQYDYDLDEQFMSGGPIGERPPPPRQQQPQQQQQQSGGEHYYSSPWQPGKPLLASPAKFLRKERVRQQPQRLQEQRMPTTARQPATEPTANQQQRPALPSAAQPQAQPRNPLAMAGISEGGRFKQELRLEQQLEQAQRRPGKQSQFSAPMPVLIIRNQWRPSAPVMQQQQPPPVRQSPAAKSRRQNELLREPPPQQTEREQEPRAPQLTREQEQQISQALERESLVQVGPAQMLPIYQSPSGRLSMTPPPVAISTSTAGSAPSDSASSFEADTSASPQTDSEAEVQTVGAGSRAQAEPANPFQPLAGSGGTPSAPDPSFSTVTTEPVDQAARGGQPTDESTSATTNATTAFSSSGRLLAPVKGKHQQSSPPPPLPLASAAQTTGDAGSKSKGNLAQSSY